MKVYRRGPKSSSPHDYVVTIQNDIVTWWYEKDLQVLRATDIRNLEKCPEEWLHKEIWVPFEEMPEHVKLAIRICAENNDVYNLVRRTVWEKRIVDSQE